MTDLLGAVGKRPSDASQSRSPRRSPSEYQLDDLDPRQYDGLVSDGEPPRPRLRKPATLGMEREASPSSWLDRPSSSGSSSKLERAPAAMFAGPPPPIAASMLVANGHGRSRSRHGENEQHKGFMAASRATIGSVLFDQRQESPARSPDSAWRALRRREQALELDVQHLLDLQAAGLLAGTAGTLDATSSSDADGHSDAGSSTPTGTFYSTASSRSQMPKSLYLPPQATSEGNVIPVRQPARARSVGLRGARSGLRKSIKALADLKREEEIHIDAALSDRSLALARLNKLGTTRAGIVNELEAFEGDDEEPLGKELRDLENKHNTLDRDIRALEDRLVAMRNRRRWLRDKMDDVKSKRDAGLSGYRGALRDVDGKVRALMSTPPVQPLDGDIISQEESASSGGYEFMRLIPERRTIEMAKTWWEAEVILLERRKAQIHQEQLALEEGGATWYEVMALVSDFESSLRGILRSGTDPLLPSSFKGKEKQPSKEDVILGQLPRMDGIVSELEQRAKLAERNRWNLLICAIGAELEAFREAQSMLKGLVGDDRSMPPADDNPQSDRGLEDEVHERGSLAREESDNEVPSDLLVSPVGCSDHQSSGSHESEANNPLERVDSENEVPPEFLAEHGKGDRSASQR
ncbi:Atg28p-like protein [Purpureocillium lavendulum]|uniref:Atg28p-like protein n=1 Tax=Purpureocillium lavendulum TaxID=1247861 RepID=A0AB34FJA1_9HYPO|nr:Atg28p-like protein [Purpureocillium lavendulum]